MTTTKTVRLAAAAFLLAAATAAHAGNSLISPNARVAVAKSAMSVSPDREWNKMGARPGRNSETWTLDGHQLNDLTFYGGIEDGRTLFREVDKRNKPLPRFSSTMLLTDVASLLENSYRVAYDVPLFEMELAEPATFAGHKGMRFRYTFTQQDVKRRAEAHAAIVGGKLYMISFEAPTLHYYDAGLEASRRVVASATLPKAR